MHPRIHTPLKLHTLEFVICAPLNLHALGFMCPWVGTGSGRCMFACPLWVQHLPQVCLGQDWLLGPGGRPVPVQQGSLPRLACSGPQGPAGSQPVPVQASRPWACSGSLAVQALFRCSSGRNMAIFASHTDPNKMHCGGIQMWNPGLGCPTPKKGNNKPKTGRSSGYLSHLDTPCWQ